MESCAKIPLKKQQRKKYKSEHTMNAILKPVEKIYPKTV